MTCYKITASALDHNGVRVDANTAEILGDTYGRVYGDRGDADDAAIGAKWGADEDAEAVFTVVETTADGHAIVDNGVVTRLLPCDAGGAQATEYAIRFGSRFVSIDSAAKVGDRVVVDEDGNASLVA